MVSKELGNKRRCTSCGMKFYDFKKSPILCPGCGTEFNPEQLLKSRRGRAATKTKEAAKEPEETLEDDALLSDDQSDDVEIDEDELPSDGDDFIAHASGDDEDDVASENLQDDFMDAPEDMETASDEDEA